MALQEHDFQVPIDHGQFFIEDTSLPFAAWDIPKTYERLEVDHLATTSSGLVVATGRLWGEAQLHVQVLSESPLRDLAVWDHAAEGSLIVHGGQVEFYAPATTGFDDNPRIAVVPGTYCALVLYGDLSSADDTGSEGDDHYLCDPLASASLRSRRAQSWLLVLFEGPTHRQFGRARTLSEVL